MIYITIVKFNLILRLMELMNDFNNRFLLFFKHTHTWSSSNSSSLNSLLLSILTIRTKLIHINHFHPYISFCLLIPVQANTERRSPLTGILLSNLRIRKVRCLPSTSMRSDEIIQFIFTNYLIPTNLFCLNCCNITPSNICIRNCQRSNRTIFVLNRITITAW